MERGETLVEMTANVALVLSIAVLVIAGLACIFVSAICGVLCDDDDDADDDPPRCVHCGASFGFCAWGCSHEDRQL